MTQLPDTLFRAYDIRGIFDDTLTLEAARLIGRAIGSEVRRQGGDTLALARDGRLSGPALLDALAEGVQACGCAVVDLGMVPTPVLYFATWHYPGVNSGVMVTGSHNPPDYNGFKIVINGTTLSGDAIQALKQRIQDQDFSEADRPAGRETRDVLPAYLDALLARHRAPRPLKVVVDCGNGVSGVIAPRALREIGYDVVPLFDDVDGTFPNHHPDPGDPENLRDLMRVVAQERADLGLAFDGDGDRLGVVTPAGEVIYPDRLMMAFAEDMLERNPGARVIFDVKCTGNLAQVIENAGGTPEMWRTGHSLIKARMKETGALLAGEMSGHIFFGENWYGFDDGLLAAVRLLDVLGRQDRDAQAFFERFPALCTTPEIPIEVTEENKFRIVEYLQNEVEWGEGARTVLDGIRMDYEDGWGLCRASNTSPKLVTRYEARDERALDAIRARFEAAIREAIDAVG
ncbi:MAG: phosphomannomutase/phosphoglucomutase [Alcanivorax sp.]|nr:phosphomannomutase/phosphoglucomutase [Alcanivorax sp.]